MSFRNAIGIYHVLTKLLISSKKPLTSVECFDSPEVRQYAQDVNSVSDYLGHMFRRGLLTREPSRGIGMAKWAYSWKDQKKGLMDVPAQRHAQPRLVVRDGAKVEKTPIKVTESEDGALTIELPNFTITIAAR